MRGGESGQGSPRSEEHKFSSLMEDRRLMTNLFENAASGSLEQLEESIRDFERRFKKGDAAEESTGKLLSQFRDATGRTVLHFAAMGRQLKNVQTLASRYPDLVECPDSSGETPLFVSARVDDAKSAVALLERGASVNRKSVSTSATPLHHSVIGNSLEALKALIEAGGEVNAPSAIGTPLQVAAAKGLLQCVEILLENGGDPNRVAGESGSPPCECPPALLIACSRGDASVVEKLLEAKASTDARDKEGWTALHCAAEAGSEECIRLLLKKNADCNVETQGKTALDLAVAGEHFGVAAILQPLTKKPPTLSSSRPSQAPPEENKNQASASSQEAPSGEESADEDVSAEALARVEELKKRGNSAFARGKFKEALQEYSQALKECPKVKGTRVLRSALHSNSSFTFANLGNADEAMREAREVVRLRPEWSKGHYRLAHAFRLKGDAEEYSHQLWQALLRDQSNTQISEELREAVQEARRQHLLKTA